MAKEVVEIINNGGPVLAWSVNFNGKLNTHESKESALKEAYAVYWFRQLENRFNPKQQNKREGVKLVLTDKKAGTSEELADNLNPEKFDILLTNFDLFKSDDILMSLKDKTNLKRRIFVPVTVNGDPVMGKKSNVTMFKGKSKDFQKFEDAEKEGDILFWYRQFRDYFFPEKSGVEGTTLVKMKPKKDAETIQSINNEDIQNILNYWSDVID